MLKKLLICGLVSSAAIASEQRPMISQSHKDIGTISEPDMWNMSPNRKSADGSDPYTSRYPLYEDLNNKNYYNYLTDGLEKSVAPEVLEVYKDDIQVQLAIIRVSKIVCLGLGVFNLGRLSNPLPTTNLFPFLAKLTTKTVTFFGFTYFLHNVSSRQWKQLDSIENAIRQQKTNK